MAVKLTEAQMELLTEAAVEGGVYAVEAYKPRQKLLELGLISAEKASGYETETLQATPAGRALLSRASRPSEVVEG